MDAQVVTHRNSEQLPHATLAYLYFLRVPLGIWLFVLVAGPVGGKVDMCRNLLHTDPQGLFWISLLAVFACRAAYSAAANIVTYGPQRFGVRLAPPGWLHGFVAGFLGGALGGFSGAAIGGYLCGLFVGVLGGRLIGLIAGTLTLLFLLLLEAGTLVGGVIGGILVGSLCLVSDRYRRFAHELEAEMWDKATRSQVKFATKLYMVSAPAIVLGISVAYVSRIQVGWDILPLTLSLFVGSLVFFLLPDLASKLWALVWPERVRTSLWSVPRTVAGLPILARLLARLRPYLLTLRQRWMQGFFDLDEHGQVLRFLPGHLVLVVLDILAIGLFWLLETRKEAELSAASAPVAASGLLAWFAPEHAPALAYILLGLAIICLIFSFFTFVFDVWRIPLLVPLLLYLWWCGMSDTDHIFPAFGLNLAKPEISAKES